MIFTQNIKKNPDTVDSQTAIKKTLSIHYCMRK